jgi:hypothetical protein
MRRRYLWLLVASAAVALILTMWGGTRTRRALAPDPSESAWVRPVELEIMIGPDGGMTPPSVQVEKDKRVVASLTNAGHRPVRVELPGYEDRLPAVTIEPGGSWRGEFLADRPGEDFAWLVDGKPAGRFIVAGSHLIEGHR